ncbi:uncharacterized protein P884DRAFT_253028 [Thermothelomyces heterothallicus CBS 202.75]|uniref:uncharacterized protein n=1 Tax=Thermothelomyces heterothallicus CBS 202.75 TaxID=1149848 RepID=UPI0037445270
MPKHRIKTSLCIMPASCRIPTPVPPVRQRQFALPSIPNSQVTQAPPPTMPIGEETPASPCLPTSPPESFFS